VRPKILIFRIGSLGDNLVGVPSIWSIRISFMEADLYLLRNDLLFSNRVSGMEIFDGTKIFKGYLRYPSGTGWIYRLIRPFVMFLLLIQLRIYRFDMLVYLVPSSRSENQVKRDRRFFRFAGIQKFVGMNGFEPFPPKTPGKAMPLMRREADLLLARLKVSGLRVPLPKQIRIDINLNENDRQDFERILSELPSSAGRTWVGIGPGSNMPAKIWPLERYQEVVRELIEQEKVWPVVLGGPEDKEMGKRLIEAWGCGYNLAGALSVRASAVALSRCKLYLGNDTGTMHLAASEKVPCVAIFSSRTYPGLWYPYGDQHRVFRTQIECEGCELVVCLEKQMKCILSIQTKEVLMACLDVLRSKSFIPQ
jgi:heptosyltransferase-3